MGGDELQTEKPESSPEPDGKTETSRTFVEGVETPTLSEIPSKTRLPLAMIPRFVCYITAFALFPARHISIESMPEMTLVQTFSIR